MPLASSGAYAPRFGFSSKERDASGLAYYGFRFHAPDLCRWITPDPIREDGGLNLYRFCGNDPVNQIDPDGEFLIALVPVALGAFGGVAPGKALADLNCEDYSLKDGLRDAAFGAVGGAIGVVGKVAKAIKFGRSMRNMERINN